MILKNKKMSFLVIIIVILLILFVRFYKRGPWEGIVVEKDSDKPISDVIVIALWGKEKIWSFPHALIKYGNLVHTTETITDSNGHFNIPSYWQLTFFNKIKGPLVILRKKGYSDIEIHEFDIGRIYSKKVMRQNCIGDTSFFIGQGLIRIPKGNSVKIFDPKTPICGQWPFLRYFSEFPDNKDIINKTRKFFEEAKKESSP